MKHALICALLFVALAPDAHAATFAVQSEAHTLVEAEAGGWTGFVQTTVRAAGGNETPRTEPTMGNVTTPEGILEFYVPQGAQVINVSVVAPQARETLPASSISKRTSAFPSSDLYEVDARTQMRNATAGSGFSLTLVFQTATLAPVMRVRYGANTLLVLAQMQPGQRPDSVDLGAFQPTTANGYHAVRTQVPAGFTYTLKPLTTDGAAAGGGLSEKYLWGGVGFLVGVLVVFLAARRGMIASRAKKFEKGGALESRKMLEARRRTLLAALKELEAAHDAKEVPDDVHGALKEEYKAQAVRVMRTLDEKGGPEKP